MAGFTEFMLLSPSLAGWSFNAYMDKDGNECSIVERNDENGNPIKRRFSFSYSNRVLRIPNAQQKVIEFLKGCPDCEGSPNAAYDEDGKALQKFYFKEVNSEKDAETVVENEAVRIEAQMKALSLKGQDLIDAAIMCGTFDSRESMQKKRVLDYSGSNPKGFIAIITGADFKTRSMLRLAVEKNVITKKGFMYMTGDLAIGSDEDSAVRFLMKDKKVSDIIKEKLGLK